MAVGREYALLYVPAKNDSSEPVVPERVDVLGISGRDVAELLSVDVDVRRPTGYGGVVEIASAPRHGCRERRTFVPLEGYTVRPDDDPPLLAIRIRTLAPGGFGFRSQRIFYRQGERRYYQDMQFEMRLRVLRELPSDREGERPCAHVVEAER